MDVGQMAASREDRQRTLCFEAMRIVAAFFVIFNHTGDAGYKLFASCAPGSLRYWAYMAISVFCKFAVPLFFMISGALMLGRDEPIRALWKRRIPRILAALAAVSLAHMLLGALTSGNFSIAGYFTALYSDGAHGSLWYLYVYLVYLVALPFLRAMVKSLNREHYLYLIAIALIYSGLRPMAEYLLWQGRHALHEYVRGAMWLPLSGVLYPLVGYFLHTGVSEESLPRRLAQLWPLNLLAIALTCAMTAYQARVTGEAFGEDFFNCFVLVNAATVFLTVKWACARVQFGRHMRFVILSMGASTFHIYLLHMLILPLGIVKRLAQACVRLGLDAMTVAFAQCAGVFLVCYLLSLAYTRFCTLWRGASGRRQPQGGTQPQGSTQPQGDSQLRG